MASPDKYRFPVDECLPQLLDALDETNTALLTAPPGAGKTTRVPPALLGADWCTGKIVVLEPRRIAARASARFVAQMLGGKPGETVGYRVRMENVTSAATRIEYVTEGVFTRMLAGDPELSGISAVIFDEFHERSLDADLGLALALDVQSALRPDLRILVMSATLEAARLRSFLGECPLVESKGRSHPVEIVHEDPSPGERLEESASKAVMRALAREPGSVLVFLPGLGEIRRTAERLEQRLPADVEMHQLHGSMEPREQDAAIRPAADGRRKIVLATSIAETSLTIDGIRIVIDSGLARVPRYEPQSGLTRLETVRAPRFSIEQRAGRAGRTQPGTAVRLWRERQTAALPASIRPEILEADLAGLVLDMAAWGVTSASGLRFLDPPPTPAWQEAVALLQSIGALDAHGRATADGLQLRQLALPPRYAAMVVQAARTGQAEEAARLAVLISERGLGGSDIDISIRLERLRNEKGERAVKARKLATAIASQTIASNESGDRSEWSAGALLSLAWPGRVARAKGARGNFLLANGRAGSVSETDPLAGAKWITVCDMQGSAASARITCAAPVGEREVLELHEAAITQTRDIHFDPARKSADGRKRRKLGAIVLSDQVCEVDAGEREQVLADAVSREGLGLLPWTGPAQRLLDRLRFLNARAPERWPDMSDGKLTHGVMEWLFPHVPGLRSLDEIGTDALIAGLRSIAASAGFSQFDIEAQAPDQYETPAGSIHKLKYRDGEAVLAVRVQELYGLTRHPSIAGGKAPLLLELLSPAMRPIQLTRDLPGFWAGSWADVRADLRGRYPKHLWPEDPANAAPTSRAKPRGA
ncbi:MAG: ATP-dependent helicase HrpB [Nitratireductor sp.]